MTDHPDKAYSIERLNSDNIRDIAVLYFAVYGKMPAKGFFERKYSTAYTGSQYVGFIAYTLQRIPIAYYGVIPCFLNYDGDTILAAQSADTMTNPDYRFKGLFVELSNLCFELCRQEGILLVFGFPNQNSYHGAVTKLGWQMGEMLQYFTIPAARLSLEGISQKHLLPAKWYRAYTNRVLAGYAVPQRGIISSVLKDGFAGVDRSEEYLSYRTYSDTKVIQIKDAMLWIKINNGLVIGDLQLNDTSFETVLREICRLAKRLGLKQIIFHASPHSELYSLFAGLYKAADSFPVLFQDFGSGLSISRIKFTFADIDIF